MNPTPTSAPTLSRRRLLHLGGGVASVVAAPAWLSPALAQANRLPTPAQTEGPFYPLDLPDDTDFDLLRNGSAAYRHGTPAWVEGVVTDTAGVPVRGAQVEIWQCDHQGHYHHPGDGNRADKTFQGFGRVTVDAQGAYRFRTLRPVPYGPRTPHIHVKVKLGTRDVLTTQLYVQGDPGNERDFLWRRLRSDAERAALTVPFVPAGADGIRARFPIVLAV